MRTSGGIYLCTVCLERNRWGSRHPSFRVSEWLPRFKADGFDGIELWEFHFLSADVAEQARLADAAADVAIFNSYVGFADGDAEARGRSADAIARLSPSAVKYNLGGDAGRLDEYRRNLLAWADRLPRSCRLLCECHSGTVLERIEDAAVFFEDFDPERFGIIVHMGGDPAGLEPWFSAFGRRVQHLHLQLRGPETDPGVPANRERLDACVAVVKAHGYDGSAAIEFTRGIGRAEEIETLYANACVDLAYCRKALAR